MASKPKKRIIIIGLDGVPYPLIENLSTAGVMPETQKIVQKGTFLEMESSIPEISSVAWSSIITGKSPAEHGIFGYTDIPSGTYRLSFPNFNNLKAMPFFHKDFVGKSVIINVPSTFPVKPINGIHISGFVSLDLQRSVYPNSLIPKLTELNYQIDVDSSKAHKSMDMFLTDLDRTLKARIATAYYLWNSENWDTYMLVFTGTDRLSHFLWDAFEKEDHKHHSAFLEHFRQIDEAIGEIAHKTSENDLLVLLSDHGFERLEKEVNINTVLRENGFLSLKPDAKRNYADMDSETKVFALEPSRLYIHSKDRFPRGSVNKGEYDSMINKLIALFNELEFKGEKIINTIHRKEEIYEGPLIDQAPDLVLISNKGFNLKASLKSDNVFEDSIFTGKHTQHDAFLLLNKSIPEKIAKRKPAVSDVYGIIEKFIKTEQ